MPNPFFMEPETYRRSGVSKARVLAIFPPAEPMLSIGKGEAACLKKLPVEAQAVIATMQVAATTRVTVRENHDVLSDIFI